MVWPYPRSQGGTVFRHWYRSWTAGSGIGVFRDWDGDAVCVCERGRQGAFQVLVTEHRRSWWLHHSSLSFQSPLQRDCVCICTPVCVCTCVCVSLRVCVRVWPQIREGATILRSHIPLSLPGTRGPSCDLSTFCAHVHLGRATSQEKPLPLLLVYNLPLHLMLCKYCVNVIQCYKLLLR